MRKIFSKQIIEIFIYPTELLFICISPCIPLYEKKSFFQIYFATVSSLNSLKLWIKANTNDWKIGKSKCWKIKIFKEISHTLFFCFPGHSFFPLQYVQTQKCPKIAVIAGHRHHQIKGRGISFINRIDSAWQKEDSTNRTYHCRNRTKCSCDFSKD